MSTSNTLKQSEYKGSKAWTVSKGSLKTTLVEVTYYIGTFTGVSLIAFSLIDIMTFYYLTAIGVVVAPISLLLKHRTGVPKFTMVIVEGEEDNDPYDGWDDYEKPNYVKMFFFYMLSALGIGLTLGGCITHTQGVEHFFTYTSIGLLLSLFSRYNLKKHKILAIIEDYMLYFLIFGGVVLTTYGISTLTTSTFSAIVFIFLGVLITPYLLITRERVLFQTKEQINLRKYLSMVSVVIGLGCTIFGIYSLLTGSWILSLITLEGILFVLGGAIFHDRATLVSLKDIL